MPRLSAEERAAQLDAEREKRCLQVEARFPEAGRFKREWLKYLGENYLSHHETLADYMKLCLDIGVGINDGRREGVQEALRPRSVIISHHDWKEAEGGVFFELWDLSTSSAKEERLKKSGPRCPMDMFFHPASKGQLTTAELLGSTYGDGYATSFVWVAAFGHEFVGNSRRDGPRQWNGDAFETLANLSGIANHCLERVIESSPRRGGLYCRSWHYAMTGAFPETSAISQMASMGLVPRDWHDWLLLIGIGVRLVREKMELVAVSFIEP